MGWHKKVWRCKKQSTYESVLRNDRHTHLPQINWTLASSVDPLLTAQLGKESEND